MQTGRFDSITTIQVTVFSDALLQRGQVNHKPKEDVEND
jgi:hypothetical protein